MMRWAILLSLVCAVGCGSESSPTTPSGTVTPPAAQPFVFGFQGETTTPAANTFWLRQCDCHRADGTNAIGVEVMAHFTAGFHKVRGNLLFDTAVLTSASYASGDFLQQGGALVTTDIFPFGNQVSVRLDRPDTLPAASGDGRVLILWFTAASASARGKSSPIQWDDPHAYTASFTDRLSRTYAGTVTVQ